MYIYKRIWNIWKHLTNISYLLATLSNSTAWINMSINYIYLCIDRTTTNCKELISLAFKVMRSLLLVKSNFFFCVDNKSSSSSPLLRVQTVLSIPCSFFIFSLKITIPFFKSWSCSKRDTVTNAHTCTQIHAYTRVHVNSHQSTHKKINTKISRRGVLSTRWRGSTTNIFFLKTIKETEITWTVKYWEIFLTWPIKELTFYAFLRECMSVWVSDWMNE